MKQALRVILTAVLLLAVAVTTSWAARRVVVPKPAGGTPVYLNRIILADTTASGARVDSNTTYVLARGGIWLWDSQVLNAKWNLRMEADTGSAKMPEIYAYVQQGGTTTPDKFVDMEGPVYVKGILWGGYLDIDPTAFASYGAPFIFFRRADAAPDRCELIGNVFVNSGQAIASAFGAMSVMKFVDNVIANDGVPPLNDVGNGRVTDLRNVSLDTVSFINNTLAYGFDRMIRHRASVGRIDVFHFDHNTVYENGGRYGLLSLGAVGSKVTITNNLLVDPMAAGSDTFSTRQSDFAEMREAYADGKYKMAWIYHSPSGTDTLPGNKSTTWKISNNYWYVTPEVQAVYDSAKKMGWNPPVTAGRPLSDSITNKLSNPTTAFTALASFAFTKISPPFAGTVLWQMKPASVGGTGGASSGGTFVPYEKHLATYYRDTMSCAYSTSSPAYTGAIGSLPAGDLNWFPTKKTQWIQTNGVEENIGTGIPMQYTLSQNYPNPFNPTTQIEFSLPIASRVTLKVFNVIGQEVASLINGELSAGQHSATFNASRLSSGVYFYTLTADKFSSTRKMMILK